MNYLRSVCTLAGITAVAAGCGAARTAPSSEAASSRHPITVVVAPGKHRLDLTELRPGDTVRCRGGAAGAVVPDTGSGVSGTADGVTSSSSISVENRGRVIVVECEIS